MRKIWRIIKFIVLFLVSLIAAAVVINTIYSIVLK